MYHYHNANLRELGSPNPVISFTWGCYRSLSGNRVGDPRRVTFWEKFVKKLKRLELRPIRPPQGCSKVGSARPVTKHIWKKHVFLKKTCFFRKTRSAITSWAPASQGRSHDATFYARCLGDLTICILQTFSFFCPVSVFFAQKGPPNEFFCTFFGSVFGRARVQIS